MYECAISNLAVLLYNKVYVVTKFWVHFSIGKYECAI